MKRIARIVFCLFVTVSLPADIYRSFRDLKEIRTEFFTIIFPEESREAAFRLASFADDAYREVASNFGQECYLRMPILITPDYEDANGYFTGYPYNRIVLNQAPSRTDDQLGPYSDDLKNLFYHELTHAVTLNVREGIWPFISALFGTYASPNGSFMMPASMTEGAAVLQEGRGGGGRAGDPYFAEYLRQDILEGKFKTFIGSGGAMDGFPFGSAPYIYGTFFSEWLRKNFGAAKTAELWRETGKGNILAGLEGFLFFKGAFEAVYGLKLSDAWDSFEKSMAPCSPVILDTEFISEDPSTILALASGPDAVYWVDSAKRAIFASRPGGEKGRTREEKIFDADGWLSDIDVSPDGGRMLLSWAKTDRDLAAIFVDVLDLGTRSLMHAERMGLREASWYPQKGRDAFLAIRISGFKTDIVLVDGKAERTLLSGADSVSYSDPRPMGEDEIAFVMRKDGRKSIASLEIGTGKLSVLGYETAEGEIGLPENPRGLSASDGRLYFSYIQDGILSRLAVLEGDELSLQETDISGGVFDPICLEENIYYKGVFSGGMRICLYPAGNEALSLRARKAVWIPYETDSPAPAAETEAGKILPYSPYPWALLSYRVPDLVMDGGTAAAFGLQFSFLDPAESAELVLSAAYDIRKPFADLSLGARFSGLPFDLFLWAQDLLRQNSDQSIFFRETSGGISVSRTVNFLPSFASLSFEASGSAWFRSRFVYSFSSSSPYAWGYEPPFELLSAGLEFSRMRENPYKSFSLEGFAAAGYLDLEFNQDPDFRGNRSKAEISARFALPYLGFSGSFWGAGSPDPKIAFSPNSAYVRESGGARYFAGGARYPVYSEYRDQNFGTNYYLFADMSIGLLDLEIQKPVNLLPLYLNRIQARFGFRQALCADIGLNSLYIRLYQKASPLLGIYSRYRIEAFIEGNYAFALKRFGWDWGYKYPL